MSSRAIVLGITADHAFAAGALLASIRAHDPGCDAAVVILHDGLDEGDRAAFQRLWPGCRFRDFTRADAEERLGAGRNAAGVARFLEAYSPLVMAKLDLPELLAEYDRVVWLDADLLMRGSLGDLWDFDCLAWRSLPQGAFGRREKALSAFPEVTPDPAIPLLNGGVIGVSRQFLERGGSSALLRGYAQRLAVAAPDSQLDELPWYLAAAELHLPVRPLPMALNHPVGAKGVDDAVVVHAIGAHKFWNATPLVQLFPDWSRHQATWISCGGRPYAGEVFLSEVHPAESAEVLRAAQARSYWLAVFQDLRPVLPKGVIVDLRHDRKYLRLFLHGRPEDEHLRLLRHPNERRMGLDVHLPEGLASLVVEAICREVKGARREGGAQLSVTYTRIGEALAAADAVIAGASPTA